MTVASGHYTAGQDWSQAETWYGEQDPETCIVMDEEYATYGAGNAQEDTMKIWPVPADVEPVGQWDHSGTVESSQMWTSSAPVESSQAWSHQVETSGIWPSPTNVDQGKVWPTA